MPETNGQPDLKVFSTGATRTRDADGERYDLITPIGLEGVARIYAEGAAKYGDKSWEKGLPISDLVNHGLRHWRLYASGDRSEDHLSKCAWAFLAAKHSEVMWPHLNQDMRREGCIPPTVDDETAASWDRLRENLARMKRDVKEAAAKPPVSEVEIREGDRVTLDDGGFRIVGPSRRDPAATVKIPPFNLSDPAKPPARDSAEACRVTSRKTPTRYYFAAARDDSSRLRMDQYRSDLQWEGHEVVSRWVDLPSLTQADDGYDLQSCDAVIVFAGPGVDTAESLSTAHRFHKKAVVIGHVSDDFKFTIRVGEIEGTLRPDGDLWFLSWESFLRDLRSLSNARKEATPSR